MRYYVRHVQRPGLGDVTSSITDAAVASLTPAIEDMMVNKVLPMVGIAIVVGSVGAAFVGTWFGVRAARAHGGIRSNPIARTGVRLRRRGA